MTDSSAKPPRPKIEMNGFTWVALGLGILAIGLVLVTVVMKDDPRFRGPPGLARDIRTFGPAEITADLRKSFPAGMDASLVATGLKNQGFEVDESARTASYDWSNGVSDLRVTANWRLDAAGKLAQIDGQYLKLDGQ